MEGGTSVISDAELEEILDHVIMCQGIGNKAIACPPCGREATWVLAGHLCNNAQKISKCDVCHAKITAYILGRMFRAVSCGKATLRCKKCKQDIPIDEFCVYRRL